MSCVKSIKIGGQSNFVAGLKTAQLCLKNRPNKNQRQRIVMFVGSPVGEHANWFSYFVHDYPSSYTVCISVIVHRF